MAQKTLERLEWPQVVDRLREHTRTPRGRARCAAGGDPVEAQALFAPSLEAVRERLDETGEARALLDEGEEPPFGGVHDLSAALRRAGKSGVLVPRELLELGSTLAAIHATARFAARRAEQAPRLAAVAAGIAELRHLEEEIDRCLDPEGEVRDSATPVLADARREARGLEADLQRRMAGYLRDAAVATALSDSFYTVRNDRYVLPVRVDGRARVPGIVHDTSGSGTTVFIEPEGMVDLNNRLKQAEIEIAREVERILRELSSGVAAESPSVERDLAILEALDLAFARARLSRELDAVAPEVRGEGVFSVRQLRHPLLPADRVVPNDLSLGETHSVLILSGPNAGGKTVAMKSLALAALMVRAGLHVPAAAGARVDLMDEILADIGDEQNIRENLSTFSAHMANLAQIVERASPRCLIALDEVGVGTDPGEGSALAQAILEALADAGARVIATTHYHLLKEMAELDARFANASVSFDPDTLAPTYRLEMGVAGVSSAAAVAARMGLRSDVLERAGAILEREDRQLDRLLVELAANRAALEKETHEARRLRAESEAVRDEYRAKLEKLQARRDELVRSMRGDLDRAFKQAHGEVAGVIRDLQRGGSARDAAQARGRLQALEARARAAESRSEVAPGDARPAVDWRSARPGDTLSLRDGGSGVLVALPDRRGRAVVQVGSARVVVPADRLRAAAAPKAPDPRRRGAPQVSVQRETGADAEGDGAPSETCDLRGLRVDVALERVVEALDRAAAAGRQRIAFIHGRGSGALRRAVQAHLAESPYVDRFEPGDPEGGGDGLTWAELRSS